MEFNIREETLAGYSKPAYSFECPLCMIVVDHNFDRVWVRDMVWRHLMGRHQVVHTKTDIVVVNLDTLPGMEKPKVDENQSFNAAAMWGLAENALVPLGERLGAALQALNFYGKYFSDHEE